MIPLRPNLFCPWLLAPIHNWHHQGSSTPSSCTTSCAHPGRPRCATSFSGQTPLVTTCEEGQKLHQRPRDRAIKQEDWKPSNQLCTLQIKYT
uniref:Secreted protein n=1 Tax=Bos taurus TaxID=9913 RepID=A0ABI0P1L3_BOVIN